MLDLHKQAASVEPHSDSTSDNITPKKGYDGCPSCKGVKHRHSRLCQHCWAWENKPPILNDVFIVDGERCRKIPLTQGLYALVSECDYDWLMRYPWYAAKSARGTYYAGCGRFDGPNTKPVKMHAVIMGVRGKQAIDHRLRNTLDNRRSCLRPCTSSDNNADRVLLQRNNGSGYRGVSKRREKWHARIRKFGVLYYLGEFSDPKEAAIVRDLKAIELHGEFAVLNFPELLKRAA